MLRQPKTVSKQEKLTYVEQVIDMLDMRDFADAVVGIPGEGLNVEQRKLLTIGVELAAKPKLLLFLDEPTSGLDSQSSWAICNFLRKLADAGQAVLCTVHQPSAVLFQQFDRLLFLAAGGKTVYFGDIGANSRTLLKYFESRGARKCGDQENPAEYMLEIVNNGTTPDGEDWHEVWNKSPQYKVVMEEIERIHTDRGSHTDMDDEAGKHSEFAMPFISQLWYVTRRIFQQYWRMPSYVLAKFFLGTAAGLFIGFSFWKADPSLAGMQNVIFGVFMVITIFSTLVQQVSHTDSHSIFLLSGDGTNVTQDSTTLSHSTIVVRSSRATKQGVLLEGVRHFRCHCRDSVPNHHRRAHLCLLLLPHHRHSVFCPPGSGAAVLYPAASVRQLIRANDHRGAT
jgi:ABC-type multidrug transport system ATPase subunit